MKSLSAFFRQQLRSFILEENAQASAEYILLLTIIVGVCITVLRKLFGPMLSGAIDGLGKKIQSSFLNEDTFHHLPPLNR